jgi:hypothetical protein
MSSGSALGNTGVVPIKHVQGLFCVMEQGPLKTVPMQAEAHAVSVASNASILFAQLCKTITFLEIIHHPVFV